MSEGNSNQESATCNGTISPDKKKQLQQDMCTQNKNYDANLNDDAQMNTSGIVLDCKDPNEITVTLEMIQLLMGECLKAYRKIVLPFFDANEMSELRYFLSESKVSHIFI